MLFNAPQRCDSLAIPGDLNCDISHPDKGSREGRTLVDLMNEYNMTNLFREPTRATATSSTLIDVILTNRPRSFLTSGTFDLGLIDHHLDYAVSRSHRPRTFPITGERRTVKNTIPNDFAMTCIRFHLTLHIHLRTLTTSTGLGVTCYLAFLTTTHQLNIKQQILSTCHL